MGVLEYFEYLHASGAGGGYKLCGYSAFSPLPFKRYDYGAAVVGGEPWSDGVGGDSLVVVAVRGCSTEPTGGVIPVEVIFRLEYRAVAAALFR